MKWILERLKEKSTIATLLTGLAGVAGFTLAPELQTEIVTAVAAIASAIAIITAEDKS